MTRTSSMVTRAFWTTSSGDFGDIYEQAVVQTVAGFFRGNSTHPFGITRFGATGILIRAGSSQHNEAVWPQSPRTKSGPLIPPSPGVHRFSPIARTIRLLLLCSAFFRFFRLRGVLAVRWFAFGALGIPTGSKSRNRNCNRRYSDCAESPSAWVLPA